jgi:hypothetical protein
MRDELEVTLESCEEAKGHISCQSKSNHGKEIEKGEVHIRTFVRHAGGTE